MMPLWNCLPYGICSLSVIDKFRTALKTHYFRIEWGATVLKYIPGIKFFREKLNVVVTLLQLHCNVL